jgi:hypothetical protein
MYALTKQITWDAVQGARRAEAEIVCFDTLRLRAPQQRRNAPKELF